MAKVEPIAHRRPWLNRSRNGPISGATIANGSMVRPRKSATWPRASLVAPAKKMVVASEMATAASPAALAACSSISRDSPDCSAPCARDARLACRIVYDENRPVTRPMPRRPRPVALAPVPSPRPNALARSAPVVPDLRLRSRSRSRPSRSCAHPARWHLQRTRRPCPN